TTALDVTIQAQVLNLLRDIQRQRGMAMLLIAHDLGVVAESAHRVAVMYAGEIVETAGVDSFFARPAHPYTRKLFDSLPRRDGREAPLAVIPGTVPSLAKLFKGCRFADRCDRAWALCHDTSPAPVELSPDHVVRCHLYRDGSSAVLGGAAPARIPCTEEHATTTTLLSVRDLRIHFPVRKGLLRRVAGHVHAVDGVDLEIPTHRTVALVGESGCGKTTVGKGLLRLLPLTAGEVRFREVDLATLSPADMRHHRKDIQIVFQDPYSSLNPRLRVKEIIEEGMLALGVGADAAEREQRIDRLLEQVGLSSEMRHRYPHEFSGGQRQRVAIARALAVEPKLIVCDEPTSALDVSVQAQILNLLRDLQRQLGLSYLFITHNISVVEYLAHEVAVMYLGRIVEQGSVDAVLRAPRHPYTQALLSAVPEIDPKARPARLQLSGEQPSPSEPPSGCHFHPRCVHATELCRRTYPERVKLDANQQVNCHLYPAAPG
ncbi:MAG: ABC transporter ATP-binding protein, partial [Betaproteobacteria bacterium]|nr:ABC transporter ATP-binding protein [Betaproteobacteria bacterium]